MFTLCMSRGHPPLPDPNQQNRVTHKQIKGGYLLRYKRGFFFKGWSEEWVVLYEDSTIAWYADKGLSRPRGYVRISEAPDLLAVGEWTRQVPKKPRFPTNCHIGQLLAIGGGKTPNDVHWLMAQTPTELNDWMTAISNTLPPPPHIPMEDKRFSLTTPLHHKLQHHTHAPQRNSNCSNEVSTVNKSRSAASDADYTVLSGVVIDWGHGWGWGQAAWAAQTACAVDNAVSASLHCHAPTDYAIGGYEEVDWSAFGDFSF